MAGSSHTPLPGDSYLIPEGSIDRLRLLKYELFEKDTSNETTARYIDIRGVPLWMRGNEPYSESFDPAVVSIGPFHHGKFKLSRMEKLKIASVQGFAKFCRSSVDVIYHKLECLTIEAMKYYDESIMANFDHEAFTVMMLLDGCFILDFIRQVEFSGKWNVLMPLGNNIPLISSGTCTLMIFGNDIPLISRDLFLCENQLPYLILKELMSCHPDLEKMVYSYINSEISKIYGKRGVYSYIDSEICITRMSSSTSTGQNHDMPPFPCILDHFHAILVGKPHLLSHSGQEGKYHFLFHSGQEGKPHLERPKRSYPPVKELLAMGITFKRKNSICLCDVEFRTHLLSGELLLPQIEMNHYTKDRFLNLIAHELSCRVPGERPFIAFICFLDTLIDHADDVKVLRSKGIICNYLGSDEEVANLVNQLATGLIHDTSAYSKVVDKIQSHLQKKWRVHIGEFMHTYFRSPWTTIALIAAGYVILLASIQTFFAVFPR